jgi:hypothetical protein
MTTGVAITEFARRWNDVWQDLSYDKLALQVGKRLPTRFWVADDNIVLKGVDPDGPGNHPHD